MNSIFAHRTDIAKISSGSVPWSLMATGSSAAAKGPSAPLVLMHKSPLPVECEILKRGGRHAPGIFDLVLNLNKGVTY